jgi:hypothetical protein
LGFESTGGTLVFDGAGNFTGSLVANDDGTISSAVVSGTYSVAADGAFTFGVRSDVHTGNVAQNGAIALISGGIAGTHPQIIVFVRQLSPDDNTSAGADVLVSNTTGKENTATGAYSMFQNSTGSFNVATGYQALYANTTGASNAAAGVSALGSNTTGNNNTAFGYQALGLNKTGTGNAAQGYYALYANTSGVRNVGVGNYAVQQNTTGQYNIGVGWNAGGNLTTGNDNIDIANFGVAAESQTMRLGRQGTAAVVGSGITRSFIAGVRGVTTGLAGTAVMIDANGQLGTISSSRRYKQDIQPMGDASERLMQLRPVKFRYKQADAKGEKPIQYGLIAEEVAEVFPELVVPNKAGRPETVAYHLLPALLLNELQNEHRRQLAEVKALKEQLAAQAERFAAQDARLASQASRMAHLEQVLAALQIQAKPAQVAMR